MELEEVEFLHNANKQTCVIIQIRFGQMLGGGLGIVFSLIGLLVSAFILYAALQMKKLKQWGMCFAASIVVMIPCITPCIGFIAGIPIGIWCIVVLLRQEVKTAFS